MKRIVTICLLSALAVISASAQGGRLRHPGGCIAHGELLGESGNATWQNYPPSSILLPPSSPTRSLAPKGDVRVPIILTAFADTPFTVENPQQAWSDIANRPGYSDHGARGSMRDYFLEQSRGLFNVSFDVLGPVTLPRECAYYGQNNIAKKPGSDKNFNSMIQEAAKLAAALPGADFSRYDWDGDGTIDALLLVYAGCGENVKGSPAELIWPKSGAIWGDAGGYRLSRYACANELLWPDRQQDGFGALLHEFSHCLGLPDLYNVDDNVEDNIYFDEWDVMDGGCYAGGGWQPVGYSAYERYLCGWLLPEELSLTTDVGDMKPLTDGGQAYLVRHATDPRQRFMLENRQQQGFDTLLPGHGLLVTRFTDFGNTTLIPNNGEPPAITPVPSDGLSYLESLRRYVRQYYGVTLPDNQHDITDEYKTHRYDENGRSRLLTGLAFPSGSDRAALFTCSLADIREADSLISFRFIDAADAIILPRIDFSSNEERGTRKEDTAEGLQPQDITPSSLLLPRSSKNTTIRIVRYPDGSVKKILR